MLGGVGDTSVIMRTVPIALTSTLYGILFANLLFLPLAVKVRERTDHELLLQKIILEGAVAIAAKMHPRILEVKLKSFLTPSQREGRLVSLARIERKFHIRPSAEATFDANGEAFSVEIGAEGREASGRAGQGEAN
ncbi:MAG: Chemotaxis protein PomA [candidate division BRC1 bacterium ADurb.BinA364]|nr:MAG: Chemotaxis protein PomA [candidate division BRC1 bacterium ADurb.BinA364]